MSEDALNIADIIKRLDVDIQRMSAWLAIAKDDTTTMDSLEADIYYSELQQSFFEMFDDKMQKLTDIERYVIFDFINGA